MVVGILALGTAWAAWPDHVAVAEGWAAEIAPADNAHASPSSITRDAAGVLHSTTLCGGYTALVLREAYPALSTTVLKNLTGSTAPSSAQWRAAILSERSTTTAAGTFVLEHHPSIDDVAVGDVLASEYTSTSGSGHTMLVASVALDAEVLSVSIPGHPTADRWRVTVFDSTSSPHGATDSRYLAEGGVNDQGMGTGDIALYTDPATGAIVGWAWTLTSATVYQGTDPAGTSYRPITAGSIYGPGL